VWPAAVKIARGMVEDKLGTVPLSPYRALDLIAEARTAKKAAAFAREDEVLAELIASDQFRASMYAFNLVQKHAKNPSGAPDKELATPVTKVGVIGAGLMASQFALLFPPTPRSAGGDHRYQPGAHRQRHRLHHR
jgi:hypothetical protein